MKPHEIKEADVLLASLESLREMLAYGNMAEVELGQIQFINEICDSGFNTIAWAQLPTGVTIRIANLAVGLIEKKLKDLGVDLDVKKA